MIVEDDDCLSAALAMLLERNGYSVATCIDAVEALSSLRAGALPELILLDLILPRMDGWEFRVQQKLDPNLASIPVIAISADSSPKAAAIDAHAYLAKPFTDELLLSTIERIVVEASRARARERAAELDRLSSLGSLAAGLSHEVNNPLAFIVGNLELAQRRASELSQRLGGPDAFSLVGVQQLMARAQRGADRIAEVVRNMSVFARADTESVVSIDVREVLESSLQVTANEIRHCAKLERDFQPVPHVRGNPAKLAQVFLNLILNALRAIHELETGSHRLRVTTETGPHRNVVVTIHDTGRVTSSELSTRMFGPFSLKYDGIGLGLGLTVSRELVESMGGTLELTSEPDVGTTARVTLPSYALAPIEAPAPPPAPAKPQAPRRRPSVLVVDDEPLLCELLRAVLKSDYDVATFTDPRAALASMVAGAFDLILCDLMMPDLTGMDLYERATAQRPELAPRFIFISGGAFTDKARSFLATTRRPQLKKPFRRQQIIDEIERLLESEGLATRPGQN